jgi:cytochrome bd ubiquinol oxidase subunit I
MHLLAAAHVASPVAARSQMGFSLGWHIILACFGVGLPGLVLFAEWRGLRTGDVAYRLLARRWAKVLGVLFAVGAVSGTILSIELGVLWSGLMTNYGQVIGLPFAIEGIAFFIEAIFLGIYLYGWDRLPPRAHLMSGIPIFAAGLASAFFVVCANAWMNTPTGFTVSGGRITHVDPWAAMFNPATGPETTHMILAALMVTGFGVALRAVPASGAGPARGGARDGARARSAPGAGGTSQAGSRQRRIGWRPMAGPPARPSY